MTTCPCVRARDGFFVLGACGYTMLWSKVFLGGSVGDLLERMAYDPSKVPISLLVWCAATALGLVLLRIGIRENLRDGDVAPVVTSVIGVAACSAALAYGWFPWWNVLLMHICKCFYVACIAGGVGNLLINVVSTFWNAGYRACVRDFGADGYSRSWRDKMRNQTEALTNLTTKYNELAAANSELEAILRTPGLRRLVLKADHPDLYPNVTEQERMAITAKFQKVSDVFDRLGVK